MPERTPRRRPPIADPVECTKPFNAKTFGNTLADGPRRENHSHTRCGRPFAKMRSLELTRR
jgi:hypothetical protein